MGVIIKSAGLDLSANPTAKILPPVSAGLEYLNFFGGAADIHTRNLAPFKPAAVMTGSLGAGADYAVFDPNTNYLTTHVQQVADMDLAFVAVAQPAADNGNAAVISNTGSAWQDGAGNTGGAQLYFRADTQSDGITQPSMLVALDDSGPATPNVAVGAGVAFAALPQVLIGTVEAATGNVTIYNMTTGTSVTVAGGGLSPARGEPFRIGTAYNTSMTVNALITAAGIYSRALDATERANLYAWIKTAMQSVYGLTV